MKFFNHVLLLFAIIFSIPSQAELLHPNAEKILFYHLTEVNEQWKFQDDLNQLDLAQSIHFQDDNQRIQKHLKLVHQVLSKRSITHLTKQQQANRQRHLAVLKSYYETAIFPTNHYHTKRQPYFVDNYEVHCAVGYLLQQDEQTEFISMIRENDNYAYIHELTKYPQLEIWAKANGFTIDELAWIQPGYPPTNEFSPVGNGDGVDGEILCFEKSDNGETLFVGGNFTTIDGVYSPSIAAFDGTNFTAISGFIGTVHDMKYYDGKLYAVGEFVMPQTQDAVNIAVWDGTTWTALQTGNMQGSINAVEIKQGFLFIGGNFQKVNNLSIPYLAHYNIFTQQWSNDGYLNGITVSNGFSVDGTVNDLEVIESQLLVAGEFTQVAPTVTNQNYNSFTTSYFAYWDGNWSLGFNQLTDTIHTIHYANGKIFLGSDMDTQPISSLFIGIWTHQNNLLGFDDEKVHDFLTFNNSTYAVGGISHIALGGISGRGILKLNANGNFISQEGAAFTNGSVKAAIEYKGKAYFGGNFDTIGTYYNFGITEIKVNGLTVSTMDLPTSTQSLEEEQNHKIWYANSIIIIEKDDFQSIDFTLFNINGQVVHQTQNINNNRHEISISDLPKGVYFYKINTENGATSGKLAVY